MGYNLVMEKQDFIKRLNNIFDTLSKNPQNNVFGVVAKEFEYLKLPQKKSLEDLKNQEFYYRGFTEKIYIEKFLVEDANEFFVGNGNFGQGIYSSKDKQIALNFTYSNFKESEDRILKFYLKDPKIIHYIDIVRRSLVMFSIIYSKNDPDYNVKKSSLSERAQTFIDFIENSNKEEYNVVVNLLNGNTSAIATILGYDAIDLSETPDREPNYLILNRGKINVLNRDFAQFISKGGRFKKADTKAFAIAGQKGE